MTRIDTVRDQLNAVKNRKPFKPFAIVIDSGERAIVKHPENIAYDPEQNGRDRLVILADELMHLTTMSAISSIVEADRGQLSPT